MFKKFNTRCFRISTQLCVSVAWKLLEYFLQSRMSTRLRHTAFSTWPLHYKKKSFSGKSSSCRFSFSAARNANTKATEYVTFGFSFCTLVFPLLEKFEPHCLSAIRIFQCFNRHNLWKFRQPTLYWESWRLCRSFINLTEWRQRRVTCQQLIGYINTREKIRYFFTCVVTAFLRAGNPCITPQFIWWRYLLTRDTNTHRHWGGGWRLGEV